MKTIVTSGARAKILPAQTTLVPVCQLSPRPEDSSTVLVKCCDQVFDVSDQVSLFRFDAQGSLPPSVRGQFCIVLERVIFFQRLRQMSLDRGRQSLPGGPLLRKLRLVAYADLVGLQGLSFLFYSLLLIVFSCVHENRSVLLFLGQPPSNMERFWTSPPILCGLYATRQRANTWTEQSSTH